MFEEGQLHDAYAEVELWKQRLARGKKKKRNLARVLRDDRRAEQHRAAAEELVARVEARPELVEEEDYEKTDWRGVA
jgi:hypothetical protein